MLVDHLLLAAGGLLGVLFLRLTRKSLYRLALGSVSLLDVILASEDDDVKLARLQTGTGQVLLSLFMGLGLIVLAVIIAAAPFWLGSTYLGADAQTPGTPGGILALSAGASLPFLWSLPKAAGRYNELSVLLHRLVLDHYNLGQLLFRRESKIATKKGIRKKERFVIISGLARSGTTSMMNELVKLPGFRSLSYANMPFLLSPNLWRKIYRPKKAKLQERSHRDGVDIGLNSAEALEEYFFKALANDHYITDSALREYALSEDDYEAYLTYQSVVRNSNNRLYLAKNNNFLIRYRSLRKMNPQFIMVIMYRQPLYHAASLLEKHRQYRQMQEEEPFVLEYMNWLGHHEFGLNQKVFHFTEKEIPAGDRNSLDYWLEVWMNYYAVVLKLQDENTLLIDYEDFCTDPSGSINLINQKAGLPQSDQSIMAFTNPRIVNEPYSHEQLTAANAIFEQLRERDQRR